MIRVSVRWQTSTYDLPLDTNGDVSTFRCQLFELTGVPPERQKISGVKGGTLKDGTCLRDLGVKDGQKLMMIGTAESLAEPQPITTPSQSSSAEMQMDSAATNRASESAAAAETELPGLRGIVNIGNTCWLASTLQCLHAVQELQPALPRVSQDSLVSALRTCLTELSKHGLSLVPSEMLRVFHQRFPHFAQRSQHGGFVQQDAEEALSALLSAVFASSPAARGVFEGELQMRLQCVAAPEETEARIETFSRLQCHIGADTRDLWSGLKAGMSETLEKGSRTLGRNETFAKTSSISKLPHVLIAQFVRFAWRQDTQQKAKVLRRVEFPFVLDVYDMCAPELQAALAPHRSGAAGEGATPGVGAVLQSGGKYELFAIITHKGRTADSGHYLAWTKREKDWLRFDDDNVDAVSEEEIRKLSGGGDWHMAYICFYRCMSSTQQPK